MLFFRCDLELSQEQKDFLRNEIRERTGEDSLFIPSTIEFIQNVPVKKDEAAPRRETAPND